MGSHHEDESEIYSKFMAELKTEATAWVRIVKFGDYSKNTGICVSIRDKQRGSRRRLETGRLIYPNSG